MAAPPSDLYICTESCTFEHGGVPVVITAGSVVRAGNPILKGHEKYFEALMIVVDHDDELTPSVAKIMVVSEAGGYSRLPVKCRTSPPPLR